MVLLITAGYMIRHDFPALRDVEMGPILLCDKPIFTERFSTQHAESATDG